MTEAAFEGRQVHMVLATSTGGVGRHVRALAAALVDAGATVVVHGPVATEERFRFSATGAAFAPAEIAAGFAALTDARAARRLRPALRDADLVHAHGLRAGLVAGVAVRKHVPLMTTWHNAVLEDSPLRRIQSVLERRVARRADMSLVVSADLADRVRLLGGRDVRVAPVGAAPLSTTHSDPSTVRRLIGVADRPMVLAIGRLHRQKGFDVLVRAAAGWADRSPRPVVVIAGDGPQRDALTAQAEHLRVPLRLLGDREDIADLLAAADVVAMPSRWEGSPLAAHEALAAGRPLVATEVGGLVDLLGPGGAILVPSEDPVALAHQIGLLLDLPGKAALLGNAARLAAQRWPDAAASAAQVLAAYTDLLGSASYDPARRRPAEGRTC